MKYPKTPHPHITSTEGSLTDTIPGQTPLHPDELADLIPSHLTLKRELNEWELINISEAIQNTFSTLESHGI